MPHEVVVTGCGIVAPLGIGVPEFGRRMFAGDSGLTDIRGTLVAPNFPVSAAGLVPRDRLGQPAILKDQDPGATPLSFRFAGIATEEALSQLPGEPGVDAIVYATSDGVHFDLIRDSFRSFDADHFDWDGTRSEALLELLARIVERRGYGRPPETALISLNNACISGNQAIGMAFQRIRSGRWERALVGGVDARCNDHNFMNFHLLGALTVADVPAREASRPFSGDRSGFVRGEGAASLLLESRERAEARGARVLGTVAGYCCTTDAYRLTDGRPDGAAVIRAMESALRDAGLTKEDVSAISAHGTSTRMNDSLETKSIKETFGARAYSIPVTSLKSQVGHATVAAGALEAVSCLLMLQEQRVSPTINYREPDPECDLDYVPNQSRSHPLEVILSNNFGFGGQNSCVVFKREAQPRGTWRS
jgi:3-oxoacyl-[acyl-carrier-protein] synthase II